MVYGLLFFILAVVITRVYTTLYKCDDLATITTAPKAIFTFLQGKMSFFTLQITDLWKDVIFTQILICNFSFSIIFNYHT